MSVISLSTVSFQQWLVLTHFSITVAFLQLKENPIYLHTNPPLGPTPNVRRPDFPRSSYNRCIVTTQRIQLTSQPIPKSVGGGTPDVERCGH